MQEQEIIRKKKRRKITPEILIKMKELRLKGYSYTDISLEIQISLNTVMYHLNSAHREVVKKRNRGVFSSKNRKEYFKEYQNKRYNSDKNFREKQKERVRKYLAKKNEAK